MDVFIGRESEKSESVRRHRDLLLALHGYLGWLLHSEAEAEEGDHRGRLTYARLTRVVEDYLEREGHRRELADEIFASMMERVVAIVSRTEGTIEFEVQPLREYFAARYLYETAQYSWAGNNRPGTKPERFDGIARSPYWLNVTRFYAGFFDKGELPMLVERLNELVVDDVDWQYTSYSVFLAATLLADWVFSQSPKLVRYVTSILADPKNLRRLIGMNEPEKDPSAAVVLADECGRFEFADALYKTYAEAGPWYLARAIQALIIANTTPRERSMRWLAEWGEARNDRPRLYNLMRRADALSLARYLPAVAVQEVLQSAVPHTRFATQLIRADRNDIVLDAETFKKLVDVVLDGEFAQPATDELSLLQGFFACLHIHATFRLRRFTARSSCEEMVAGLSANGVASDNPIVVNVREQLCDGVRSLGPGVAEYDTWRDYIERTRERWGDRIVVVELALDVAEAMGQVVEFDEDALSFGLGCHERPLLDRILWARDQGTDWWQHQMRSASSEQDRFLVCHAFVRFASTQVVSLTQAELEAVFTALPSALQSDIQLVAERAVDSDNQRVLPHVPVSAALSDETVALVATRLSKPDRLALYRTRYLGRSTGKWHADRFCAEQSCLLLLREPGLWRPCLQTLAAIEELGVPLQTDLPDGERPLVISVENQSAILEIVKNPMKYPLPLFRAAEQAYRSDIASKLPPVAKRANDEHWFS